MEKLNYAEAIAYGAALTARERAAGRLPALFEYRLPTEAEWEYACKAGATNLFSFGDAENLAAEYAWTEENPEGLSLPVWQKKPTPWGLHDLHGNVWEWCQDWMGEYTKGEFIDPPGAPMGKYGVFAEAAGTMGFRGRARATAWRWLPPWECISSGCKPLSRNHGPRMVRPAAR